MARSRPLLLVLTFKDCVLCARVGVQQLEGEQAAAAAAEDFDTAAALDERLRQLAVQRGHLAESEQGIAASLAAAAQLRLAVRERQLEAWSTAADYLARLQVHNQGHTTTSSGTCVYRSEPCKDMYLANRAPRTLLCPFHVQEGQQQVSAALTANAARQAQEALELHRSAQEAIAQVGGSASVCSDTAREHVALPKGEQGRSYGSPSPRKVSKYCMPYPGTSKQSYRVYVVGHLALALAEVFLPCLVRLYAAAPCHAARTQRDAVGGEGRGGRQAGHRDGAC